MTHQGATMDNSNERVVEADGNFTSAMIQGVEFSPDLEEHIYVEAFNSVSRNVIQLERPVYNEETLARRFKPQIEEKMDFHRSIKRRLRTCSCSAKDTLLSLFPICGWLPQYNMKRNFIADFTGGLTVGIFHIPQGLGFAMLASLPPVTGLYTALVPVLVYMLMGTSRHLSQGSFAVICLMAGAVINREVQNMGVATTGAVPIDTSHGSVTPPTVTASNLTLTSETTVVRTGLWSPLDARKMEVAVTLTLVVGLIQVLMGVVRLGFVATYLSDPLISGFTTGAAVVVVITQVKLILQLPVPQSSGVLASCKTVFLMLKHLPQVNVGSLITGVLCLFIILSLKYINEKYKKRLKIPIPAELVVVILGTAIGYGGELNKNFDVSVLGEIQKGLPPISVPTLGLVPNILVDSFVIAVVIFATNITLSKMFAKKNRYSVDANQELIAYGASNISGAFFSCFPICNALARSVAQENLANTQLCSVVVVVLIMIVLAFVAPLFYDLPKAILGAVVIANLVGLLKQFKCFKNLWKICKPDAVVWFSTCAGVVLLGVDLGLGFGVVVSLLCVIFQSSRPYFSLLGQLHKTEIYRDVREFEESVEEPQGIKIFKFDSSLYFANVEHFRNALVSVTGIDPSKHTTAITDGVVKPGKRRGTNRYLVREEAKLEEAELLLKNSVHTIIIDGSSFTFIDSVGISALTSLVREHKSIGVDVYIAGCPFNTRKKLVQGGFHQAVGKNCLFATVHDAASCAALLHKTPSSHNNQSIRSPFASKDFNSGLPTYMFPLKEWLESPETDL